MVRVFLRFSAGLVVLTFAFAQGVYCADLPVDLPPTPTNSPQLWTSTLYEPTHWEVRGGVFDSIQGKEAGSIDINAELVLPKFYTVPGIADIFIPRLHVGGTGNMDGKTSYGYAGAVWTLNYTENLFGEIFVGGAIHDGQFKGPDPGLSNLGCRELIHTGVNFGYRFDKSWTTMITFDHLSNGKGTLSDCIANEGINVLGLRVGHSF